MKTVSFKLLLLLLISTLLVTVRGYVKCETTDECMDACRCEDAFCDLHRCYFGKKARNKINVNSSRNNYLAENKRRGGGSGGPPPTN
ncbi:hypothetical protein HID58_011912 [Brassica napus]|uniref:Uncharacterized protein n=1 Tax=Brassica napus TaxID=3708 RepID=A0ABQ8E281_BRANA|nr:hypothetical protein HID58_011912 [Brassica napus]